MAENSRHGDAGRAVAAIRYDRSRILAASKDSKLRRQ